MSATDTSGLADTGHPRSPGNGTSRALASYLMVPTEVVIECIRQEVKSGKKCFPLYIGFAPADEVELISEAPAFMRSTPHQEIAKNVTRDPVKSWQRPINEDRVGAIAKTFDDTGRLMPNPVLLAANAFVSGGIKIDPKLVGPSKLPTGVMKVRVTRKKQDPAPLWILDGQHRISGLAASKQSKNALPVVLLLDPDAGSYEGSFLAAIFAQVTTKAEQLDELHHEWLTYAFKMGKYELGPGGSETPRRNSLGVSIALCDRSNLAGVANPFFNAIAFNHFLLPPYTKTAPSPRYGGFSYSCVDLCDLVETNYYKRKTSGGVAHLAPQVVADEMASSYTALYPLVGAPDESVFFGLGKKSQRIMHDAFFVAVLERLRTHGAGTDWPALLKELRFDTTDWDFDSWTLEGGLSGPWSTASRKVARAVLAECFRVGSLPAGVTDIASYMQGDGASVTVTFSELTATGQAATAKAKKVDLALQAGNKKARSLATHPHVRVHSPSANVGKFIVWEKGASTPTDVALAKKGLVLPRDHCLPWTWSVEMRHYGGMMLTADITLKP